MIKTLRKKESYVVKKVHIIRFIAISGLLVACGGSSQRGPGGRGFGGFGGGKKATSVEVKTVEPAKISQQIKAYGTVQSDALVRINPQVNNRIVDFFADLGDEVKPGQVLAKIYDRTFRDQVLRDRAQVNQTRVAFVRDSAAYARSKKLFDQGLSSDAEYQQAQAAYQASRAQLASSQANLTQSIENLQNTEIKSPVAGVIVRRNGEVGDLATSGQTLFEISNNSGYEIRLFLPLQDWEDVRVGQLVDLRITNQPNNTSKGIVTRISPQLDAISGLGEVVVTIEQGTNAIYAGALTESRINVITKENAITIPRSAMIEKVQTFIDPETNTIKLERTYSIFVTDGDSVAIQRDIVVGLEQGDRVEVLSGISAGEKLVITGQGGLEDKGAIRIPSKEVFKKPQGRQLAKDDSTKVNTPATTAQTIETVKKGS